MGEHVNAIEIKRYDQPSKMDSAPYGTRCVVDIDTVYYDLYIQLSSNEDEPNWEYMGKFRIDEKPTIELSD